MCEIYSAQMKINKKTNIKFQMKKFQMRGSSYINLIQLCTGYLYKCDSNGCWFDVSSQLFAYSVHKLMWQDKHKDVRIFRSLLHVSYRNL